MDVHTHENFGSRREFFRVLILYEIELTSYSAASALLYHSHRDVMNIHDECMSTNDRHACSTGSLPPDHPCTHPAALVDALVL